ASLEVAARERDDGWQVTARLAAEPPAGATVWVLWKSFAALQRHQWQRVRAERGDGLSWSAAVPSPGRSGFFAVEVSGGPGNGWRYPDLVTQTPYLIRGL